MEDRVKMFVYWLNYCGNRAKMYVKYSCLKFPLFVVSLDISSGGKLICIDNNYNNNYICIKYYNKCQVFTDLEAAY